MVLTHDNFSKSAPDSNSALIPWTNHLFFCFLSDFVMHTLLGIRWVEKAAVLSAYGLRGPAWAWGRVLAGVTKAAHICRVWRTRPIR